MIALVVAACVVTAIAVGRTAPRPTEAVEGFEERLATLAGIHEAYDEVLGRAPSEEEIRTSVRRGESQAALRRRLRATDEFSRKESVQSNVPGSESRLLARDAEVIARMKRVYEVIRGEPMPSRMGYPLRDIYLTYRSDERIAGILSAEWFPEFQREVMREVDQGMDRPKMLRLLRAVEGEAEARADLSQWPELADLDGDGEPDEPRGSGGDDGRCCPAGDGMTDLDKKELRDAMRSVVRSELAKLPTDGRCDRGYPKAWDYSIAQYDPNTDLHLRPEFRWAVPMPMPPPCMHGDDHPAEPVVLREFAEWKDPGPA